MRRLLPLVALAASCHRGGGAREPAFRALAFFTARQDQAHISFVREAVRWLPETAARNGFRVDTTSDWTKLNADTLARYQVVVFLDTRPESAEQRAAFRAFVERGGGFLGFHFSAFALGNSAYPANWAWYHDTLLASGQYASNTWRPTSAVLRVENRHPVTAHLPVTFRSQPNEWYRWERDLRANPDVEILLAIDPTSFPLGTGPKPHEIWRSGYYPVAWTNRKYRMLYFNMGHNDIDYEHRCGPSDSTLSHTLGGNPAQDRLVLDALLWLGRRGAAPP